jgi:hypothetical protein
MRSRSKMIDDSKELNESFSSFDDSQSLEYELNEIEETFRDPNILIESIKERHAAKTRRDIK